MAARAGLAFTLWGNIYLSCRWVLPCDVSKLSGLSLVAGIAVVHALEKILPEEDFQLKWPNDIWHNGKKLGGILIEMLAEAHSNAVVIIGIGLNMNMRQDDESIGLPWTSLVQITQKVFDRNLIIMALIEQLLKIVPTFCQHGFQKFQETWQQYDALKNNSITINNLGDKIHGQAQGVGSDGALLVKNKQGEIIVCQVGDASLK